MFLKDCEIGRRTIFFVTAALPIGGTADAFAAPLTE